MPLRAWRLCVRCRGSEPGHLDNPLERRFPFDLLSNADQLLADANVQARSTFQSRPEGHIEVPIPVGCRMATVPVGQVLDDAFRRAIPVIEHYRRVFHSGKRRVRPSRLIQTPLINTQLLMSQP